MALDCAAMVMIENPALEAFVAQMGDEVVLAQVFIRRDGSGYELRHIQDRDFAAGSLRAVRPAEARLLAQFTSAGEFRPLKAAPTLQGGWRLLAATDAELASIAGRGVHHPGDEIGIIGVVVKKHGVLSHGIGEAGQLHDTTHRGVVKCEAVSRRVRG